MNLYWWFVDLHCDGFLPPLSALWEMTFAGWVNWIILSHQKVTWYSLLLTVYMPSASRGISVGWNFNVLAASPGSINISIPANSSLNCACFEETHEGSTNQHTVIGFVNGASMHVFGAFFFPSCPRCFDFYGWRYISLKRLKAKIKQLNRFHL